MRPVSNSITQSIVAGLQHWNSPLPNLFCGLALMMGLITMALIILACSYRKSLSNPSSDDKEKPAKQMELMQPEMEPKIVVLMPGDTNPTYFAKRVSWTCPSEQASLRSLVSNVP
ncbi:hypothetical protein CFOL_v3_28590 [Cephalotus follicularis]|uniref:Uncharacterized protein n=1 Tax=Cephalotus follicularis TaxID=3775 RepID=A0A1Q3CY83_CEPFO|nr:hypothetical protein CFOL_v3_28590 [Cephalotus follicularis]